MGFEECLSIVRETGFVEFRFDLLELKSEEVVQLLKASRRSIATFRPGNHKNEFRLQTMISAIKDGATYADIELDADTYYAKEIIKTARQYRREIIFSYHNFDMTPELQELKAQVDFARRAGADVIKIACQVNYTKDIQTLMSLYLEGERMVVIGMGEKGFVTRVAAPFMGAEFTFASPGRGLETAPGQIDWHKLSSILDEMGAANIMNLKDKNSDE